jgi:coproporphyrinogen III oxidase-like Fe-S oxidoreductase
VERYTTLVEAGQLPLATHEVLTPRQALAEQLILGLRTSDGIDSARLAERCDLERGRLPEVLDAWRERGLLADPEGRVRLTEAGFLLSDALFTELL